MRGILYLLVMVVVSLATGLIAEERPPNGAFIEKWPNSQRKAEGFSKNGALQGPYNEYFENGRQRVRAVYAKGQLHGTYQEYYENGKTLLQCTYDRGRKSGDCLEYGPTGKVKIRSAYVEDVLQGRRIEFGTDGVTVLKDTLFVAGVARLERDKKTIDALLAQIEADTQKGSKLSVVDTGALIQLKQARMLAGVPYKDIVVKEAYTAEAQAAAELLVILGRLDHHPPQVKGVSDALYRLGKPGCGHSNLAMGYKTLAEAMLGWLDDSDERNRNVLGHRRWMLDPKLVQTGFGQKGHYYANYVLDQSRKDTPDFKTVAWPADGYHPARFFGPEGCWNVSLNPAHFQTPDVKKIRVTMYGLGKNYAKPVAPLSLDILTVSTVGCGVEQTVIFRPKQIATSPGNAFLVEIDGLKDLTGAAVPFSMMTEFY